MNELIHYTNAKNVVLKLCCISLLFLMLLAGCSQQSKDSLVLPFPLDEIEKVRVTYIFGGPPDWLMKEVTKTEDIEKIYRCFDQLKETEFDKSIGIIGGRMNYIDFITKEQKEFHVYYHARGAVNLYGYVDDDNVKTDDNSNSQKVSPRYYETEQDIGALLDDMKGYELTLRYPEKSQ